MEQLTFELAPVEAPSLANFVPGANAELLARLADLVGPSPGADTCVVIWGAAGSGKTHLLRACVTAAAASGRAALYSAGELADDAAQRLHGALIAIDDVDRTSPASQGTLFTLYNLLATRGNQLVVGASMPPARMPIREDLRTRLGQGLVYEVVALSDREKADAMARFAASRGFALSTEVIDYLLARGRRDLTSLLASLASLDRHSLAQRRPITVPLVREWLAQNSDAR